MGTTRFKKPGEIIVTFFKEVTKKEADDILKPYKLTSEKKLVI